MLEDPSTEERWGLEEESFSENPRFPTTHPVSPTCSSWRLPPVPEVLSRVTSERLKWQCAPGVDSTRDD